MEFQLIVLRGRSASKAVKLAEGITTVGRQDDCQLRIASAQVSRKHCQLFEHKGHLLVKDLGSANGTFVNGQKVAPQRVLEAGDELAIGPIRFRIEKLSAAGAAARPAVSASDTAVGPAAANAAGDQEPAILGAPVHADMDVLGESNDFEVIVDDLPDPLGDDDTIAIEMDDEAAAAPPTRPAPAPRPTPPPPPPAHAEDKDMGDDAVADFLLSIKADDD